MVNCKMILFAEVGAGFRCSVGALLQLKAVSLAPGAAGAATSQGLLGNDVSKNYENLQWFAQIPFLFFSLLSGFVTLVVVLGYTGILAISLTVICLAGTCSSVILTKRAERSALHCADKRLSILLRVIEGIRAVKFNGWETRFFDKVVKARAEECKYIRRFRWLQEFGKQVGRGAPVLIPCICFLFLAATGTVMDSAQVFPALLVFESMRSAFVTIALLLGNINNWLVSTKRIEQFLWLPDMESLPPVAGSVDVVVELKSALFEWPVPQRGEEVPPHDGAPKMFGGSGITLEIRQGEAVALIGQVGSGKTTLLASFLGVMRLVKGSACVDASIGYAPQRAFIVSGTVRYNVLMGRPWDKTRFDTAVRAACLARDLEDLPGGAETEIGERGVTLSGGQQQRVSVARAIYGCPKLLLLDDPLAAVDPVVAREMFEGIVQGRTQSQIPMTVVMALNQPQFVQHFDQILQLEDCTVSVQGTWKECKEMLRLVSAEDAHEATKAKVAAPTEEGRRNSVDGLVVAGTSLVAKEKVSTAETFQTLRSYGRSMGCNGVAFVSITLVAYLVFGATGLILTYWVDASEDARANGEDFDSENARYCIIFGSACLLHAVLAVVGGLYSAVATVGSSEQLHNDCVARVLRAPVAWWDATPAGRLTSRFSSDCSLVDNLLSIMTEVLVSFSSTMVALVVTICWIAPFTTPVLIVCAGVFGWLIYGVDRSNRMVRRHANMANAPVLGLLGEIGFSRGQIVVRAMKFGEHYAERYDQVADAQIKLLYNSAGIVMWSTGASYIVGGIIAGGAVLLMFHVGDHSGADVGLVVTYTFAISFFMQLMSTIVTQFLTFITALERLLQCLREVPQEPEWESSNDKALVASWPANGMVEFRNTSLVYRPGLPPALEGVSFTVPAGTSAGIVGRTGSGKSSLLVLLFRIVEAAAGEIFIDGVNIAGIGLHALRKAMAIIPQEPLLLEGSIRTNVDPFGDKTDDEVAQVCSSVGLIGDQMQSITVGAGTSELSAGQRQLVSLARTLLRHSKLIAFDEPTSNIDLATDRKVQQTMRTEFKGSTTLTIAHRLETIIDCDQVIVMDSGKVRECGNPAALLANTSSTFAEMARNHGGITLATEEAEI